MARYYMLTSIAGVLQHQFQSNDSTASIMDSLKSMFGDHMQVAMQRLMGAKMAEGTSIREHVLKMIRFLNELETLGATIDTQTQVDIILNSLPGSFAQFKLNYNMNQMNFSISELMSSLQLVEGVIKPEGNVLNVERASTSASMPKGKKGKKKKSSAKGPRVGLTPKIGKSKGKGKGKKDGKGKGNCFQCRIPCHWKRDCSDFLATKV